MVTSFQHFFQLLPGPGQKSVDGVHILAQQPADLHRSVTFVVVKVHHIPVLVGQGQYRCQNLPAIVRKLQRETAKTEKDLHNLRNEIMKALDGSSAFTPELLGGMIKEQEAKYAEQQTALEAAQKEAENTALVMQEMSAQYNQFVEWAYVYDTASMETRKMIVAQLFERIEVYRDYKLKIKFTISVEQFLQGLDNIA